MKKILMSLAVLLALTGLNVGCSDSDEMKPDTEQAQDESAR